MATKQRLHFRFIPVILCLSLGTACGQVSAPIPPEDVGIEAKVRKQQKQIQEQEKPTDDEVPIEEESVELPPLRPIGTR